MNKLKSIRTWGVLILIFGGLIPAQAAASPWAEKEGYGAQTGGKFVFGLKHTLFSWANPWAEAHDPKYGTKWTGFCAGIGKSVVYTAAGAIQLVTFPIPVDFPNVGLGMHIPANHTGKGLKPKTEASGAEPQTGAASVSPDSASPMPSDLSSTPQASEAAAPDAPAASSPEELADLQAIEKDTAALIQKETIK